MHSDSQIHNSKKCRCLFLNKRSILVLKFKKLWECRNKNVGGAGRNSQNSVQAQFCEPKSQKRKSFFPLKDTCIDSHNKNPPPESRHYRDRYQNSQIKKYKYKNISFIYS